MANLVYIGSLLILIGTIWLVITAIQTGKTTGEKAIWAIVNLICQPIGGIIFYIMNKVGLVPLILVIIGVILTGVGYPALISQVMQNMPK